MVVAVPRQNPQHFQSRKVGLRLRYTAIHDLTGDQVDAEDSSGHSVSAIEQPTRMHTDCLAGAITGCDGSFENLWVLKTQSS